MAKNFTFTMHKNVSAETVKFMNSVIAELKSKQSIEDIDSGALHMLMTSYEMYLQATERLLNDGPLSTNKYGDIIPHPAQTIATKNYNQVLAIMKEYGLTVKSRTNMKMYKEDEPGPLDRFLPSAIEMR